MRAGSRELVLAYLEACPDATSTEIATASGVSRDTVRRTLRTLCREGKVEYTESVHKSKGNRYRLASPGSEWEMPVKTRKVVDEPAPITDEEAKRAEEKARLKKEWLAYRKQKWGYR